MTIRYLLLFLLKLPRMVIYLAFGWMTQQWQALKGLFRSLEDIKNFVQQADRLREEANSFRWLFLNQRIGAEYPFLSPAEW